MQKEKQESSAVLKENPIPKEVSNNVKEDQDINGKKHNEEISKIGPPQNFVDTEHEIQARFDIDSIRDNEALNINEKEIDIIYELNNNEAFADEVYNSMKLCVICAKNMTKSQLTKPVLKYLDMILNITNVDITKYPVQLSCCYTCYYVLLQIDQLQKTVIGAGDKIYKKIKNFYKGYKNTNQNNSLLVAVTSLINNDHEINAAATSSLKATDEDATIKTEIEDLQGECVTYEEIKTEDAQQDKNANNERSDMLKENENISLCDTGFNQSFVEKNTAPIMDDIGCSQNVNENRTSTTAPSEHNLSRNECTVTETAPASLSRCNPFQIEKNIPVAPLSDKSDVILENDRMKMKCNICQKILSRNYYLQHMYLHNISKRIMDKMQTAKMVEKEPDPLKICSICRKHVSNLKSHALCHKCVYATCELCGKKIKAHNLSVHMRRHRHKEERNEIRKVCHQCGKSFISDTAFKKHEVTHGEQQYKCDLCDKTFYFEGNLDSHMRSHTGEKPFACTYCNRSFSLRWNMVQHIRLHTNSKPYKCSVCSASFRHNVTLKGHLRAAHSASEIAISSGSNENKTLTISSKQLNM